HTHTHTRTSLHVSTGTYRLLCTLHIRLDTKQLLCIHLTHLLAACTTGSTHRCMLTHTCTKPCCQCILYICSCYAILLHRINNRTICNTNSMYMLGSC